MSEARWTDAQVAALNAHQKSGQFHPFTCPGGKQECESHRDLIATNNGWICACGDYKQYWAHPFMFGGKEPSP